MHVRRAVWCTIDAATAREAGDGDPGMERDGNATLIIFCYVDLSAHETLNAFDVIWICSCAMYPILLSEQISSQPNCFMRVKRRRSRCGSFKFQPNNSGLGKLRFDSFGFGLHIHRHVIQNQSKNNSNFRVYFDVLGLWMRSRGNFPSIMFLI